METVHAVVFVMFGTGLSREEFLQHTRNAPNVLFTGVGNAQGFLVNVVVFSVTVVTNHFIKGAHSWKIINLSN